MSKIFYIADLHHGHKNVLRYDNRPFSSIAEMDEVLVNNWNNVVSDEDTVYILGDMFWYGANKSIEILKRLNGHKYLIKGNHDNPSSNIKKYFEEVVNYKEIDDDGRKVVLCHYPIVFFKNQFHGWYHLYGHVHNSGQWEMTENIIKETNMLYNTQINMYNVGCMMSYMDYTPKTLDEIIEGAKNVQTNYNCQR